MDLVGHAGGQAAELGEFLLVGELHLLPEVTDGLHHQQLRDPLVIDVHGGGVDFHVQPAAVDPLVLVYHTQRRLRLGDFP
jgi:hypothetical protein